MGKTKGNQDRTEQQSKQHRANQGERQSSQAIQTMGERGKWQQGTITRRGQFGPAQFMSNPFTFLRRFGEDMDRLFEDFGMGSGLQAPMFEREFGRSRDLGEMGMSMWSPQVELFERGNKLVVRADLPGMTRDDVNVEIADGALVIRGERRSEREENEEGFYRTERSYGSFYRRIPLPEGVNAENANATFHNGVLEITMPAPQNAEQRRRLEIREGTEGESQPRAQSKAAGQS
jgi:HSP20 family protein